MAAPNAITAQQLVRLIGTPLAPLIVDVRTDEDFKADPFLVPASVRHSHTDIDGLKQRAGTHRCVILCQKGKKLSQGLVAWLRSDGLKAEYLDGGMYAWRDDPKRLRVPAKTVPMDKHGNTLWVTRQRPKIDRIACPWLIRRFIDPEARFLFVAASEVDAVADRFKATPFDHEGVFWSHRGTNCTFDSMLDEFQLHSTALDRMATVIRGADTNRHDLAPEAAGLLALSVGLSRQYRDDQQQLEAGLHLYDAMYRWARDGFEEGHDWPADRLA